MSVRLFLVDDHQLMLDGLRLMLAQQPEVAIVGMANNCDEAWQRIDELRPDVVLMDLDVPGEGGVALTARIAGAVPATRVLVLTGTQEADAVQAALQAGARGYVLKLDAGAELMLAIRAVIAGEIFVSPRVAELIVADVRRRHELSGSARALSTRERDIIRRIADGQSTKEIAFDLQLSAKTIETHRLNVMEKIGVKSVAEITKFAVREGLVKL